MRQDAIMSGSKPLVLFFNPIDHAHGFLTKLQEVARTEVVTSKSREEWFKDLEGKYKDVYVIYRTTTSGEVRNTSGEHGGYNSNGITDCWQF